MTRGSILHLIYIAYEGTWSEVGSSSVGDVNVPGLLTAGTIALSGPAFTAAQFNGTAKIGTTTGNINLALEIFHASGSFTNGASYLICRNSTGADIGGFSQAGQNGINVHYLNLVSTSDYRLKHDICSSVPEESLSRITALRPVTYAWEDDSRAEGFLAHELGEHVPGAVFGEKDAVDDKGEPVYQRIDVTKLIPHLVGAIQELTRRLAALEQSIAK
jgi:hypothetical protein